MTESQLYNDLAVEATRLNHRLHRNNIGVARYLRDGQVFTVRYGIPGPGGSDMIGYTLRTITQEMVGTIVPVFTAIEGKSKGKKAKDDQRRFLESVRSVGGIAGVCTTVEDYRDLIGA